MAEIISCPRCQRKLRLDDSFIGQDVQCPSCEHTFVAEQPAHGDAPRLPNGDSPAYRPLEEDLPHPPRGEPHRGQRDDGDKDEDYPRPRRRRPRPFDDDDLRPHRGTSVLVIGIISLAIFFSLPGLVLAIVALSLGLSDLGAMNRGEMMPDGRGQTKAGVTCAIVALSLELLLLVSCCGFGFFSNNF